MANRRRRNESGMALLVAVLATIVILGAVGVVVHRVHSVKVHTDQTMAQIRLSEVCQAGVDLAIESLWNQYLQGNGNTTGNLASYRVFISDRVPNNEDLNRNGIQDEGEFDRNGNGIFEINDPIFLISSDDPRDLASGGRIEEISLSRTDDLTGTDITITVVASLGGITRTAVQTVRVGGELFHGFEYSVLANNINCILCHAEFLSLDMQLASGDPTQYGTFDRIKVASLESTLIRRTEAHSNIAGTLYTRGRVYNMDGSSMSASQLANSKLRGYAFSSDNGKLDQDSGGRMTGTGLVNAGFRADGRLQQFANLYMDYPSDKELMTDGNLPQSFPAPFPDENDNRLVDDSEFDTVMNSANGFIRFDLDPGEVGGSIQGGVAYGVPSGQAYSGSGLPSSSNSALDSLGNNGFYDGNLILVGTENDPIVINNSVAVNGDLIIKGPVKGWGQILVRGNTYVIGDVTYADAPGKFGEATDGTKNGLALSAGGSIMIGDYLTNRAKNDRGDNSTYQGKFINTRVANQSVRCRNGTYTQVGYFDSGVTDMGWANGSEGMFSFTTSELMLFNRMEYQKSQTDPNYTPRYYRIRPTQPIYQYVGNDEHAITYFDPNVEIIPDTSNAVIHDLNPKDYWITEDLLRQFWFQDEMSRTSKRPFKFDGLLYCNNSIFAITRSFDRHRSNTYGEMQIRGSVVTADLGMLIPGKDFSVPRDGLKLYYDKRVNDFFRVEDTTRVQFRRIVFRQLQSGQEA